jgi:hypothetical protein
MADAVKIVAGTAAAFILLLLLVVVFKPRMFQENNTTVQNGQCQPVGTQPSKCCTNCAIDVKKFIWVFLLGFIILGVIYAWAKHTSSGAKTMTSVRESVSNLTTRGPRGPPPALPEDL